MQFRLFVENTELDVPHGLSAQFTYSIDDIRDYASRNTAWSKTIVLPGTARNKRAFGHIFEMGSGNFHNSATANIGYNFNAAKGARAIITQDGIPIFKGVLRLLEIIIDGEVMEFETAVFGELGGLVAAMGDRKLEDLQFGHYVHVLNTSFIEASWTDTPGSGYYYPLIDYGYTTDGISFAVESLRPAFYVKEYIDSIFYDAGYTYESDFFNTDYFKKLIVPFSGAYMQIEVATVMHLTDGTHNGGTTPMNIAFDSVVGTSYMTLTDSNQVFHWKRQEKFSAKLTFSASYNAADNSTILVNKNGTTTLYSHAIAAGTGNTSFTMQIDMDYGDTLAVLTQSAGSITLTGSVLKIEGQPTVKIAAAYGDTIDTQQQIPKNVLQRDFLKWIVQLFNLYLDEDRDREKHLKIEPYTDYYEGAAVTGWENRLDQSQPVRIRPMGELGSRIYEYKYKDDSDYYNDQYKKKFAETYGTYLYDSGFEFINDKQTVEVGFSPSPLVQYAGTDRVLPAILKKTETKTERIQSNLRIMFRAAANITCQSWNLTNAGVTVASYTTYPYAGHLDDPDAPAHDLNFGSPKEFFFTLATAYLSANLFNVFWSWYLSEITDKDSKLLTASFRLSPADMYMLDFSKLIFLKGQHWRLNKVMDYSTDQPSLTKCELIKVIDRVV